MKAATNILHDGKLIEAGSSVDKLPKDVIENLKASGAISEDKTNDDLTPAQIEDKKAQLRSELAALEGKTEPVPATPGTAAENLAKEQAIAKLVSEGKTPTEAKAKVEADAKKAAEDAAKQNNN